jgi:hypothetical protein
MLAARQQKTPPEDPSQFLVEYFREYKNPFDEKKEEWRAENEVMKTEEIPTLHAKIAELEAQLAAEKRRTVCNALFNQVYGAIEPTEGKTDVSYTFV